MLFTIYYTVLAVTAVCIVVSVERTFSPCCLVV